MAAATTQASASQEPKTRQTDPFLSAQAGTAAGYDRQMSSLLVRCCGLAVAQHLYSLENSAYDGTLRLLPTYSSQFDRYTQVASFRASQLNFSEAPDPQTADSTVATKAVDVAISIREVFFGYALTSDTHHIIALRGTQTNNEWINNASSRQVNFRTREPQYGRVHRGFQTAYEKVITQIRRAVQQLNPALPLYVTGHSLGGAVAIMTAANLTFDNSVPRGRTHVYTYGSPRVGDPTFARFYNGLLPNTFRVVNLADTVPITPPESFRGATFQHVGQEWSYLAQLGNIDSNHSIETHREAIDQGVEVNQVRSYPISAVCT